MGLFDITNTFTGGTKAKASEVNTNFSEVSNASKVLAALRSVIADRPDQFNYAYNQSSGTVTLTRGRRYSFRSFTLSGTATLTVDTDPANDGLPLIIVVENDVSITNGTIDLSGKGKPGGTGGISNNNGSLGNGTDLTAQGGTAKSDGGVGGAKGTGGGGSGGAAGAYTAFPGVELPDEILVALNAFAGSGGGGGGGGDIGASQSGGNGGDGGACLILIAGGNVTFSGGTIDLSGDNGQNASAQPDDSGGGGGGGGAGDLVILHDGTFTGGGTTILTGGTGGAGDAGASTAGGGGGGGAGSQDDATAGAAGAGGTGGNGGNGAAGSSTITVF